MNAFTLPIKILLILIALVLVYFVVSAGLGDNGPFHKAMHAIGVEKANDDQTDPADDEDHDGQVEDDDIASGGDDDDDDIPSRVENHEGLPAVRLSAEAIQKSGIQTKRLQSVSHLQEQLGTGEIINFQALLESQSAHQQIAAEKKLASESLQASQRMYERLRVLHKDRANVSLSQVEEARFRMTEDRARELTAEQRLQSLRLRTTQQWGAVLTRWALGDEEQNKTTDFFDRLMDQKDVLLIITLPYGFDLPDETSFIYINAVPDRTTSRKAYLISSASHTDPLTQGITYYFRTDADQLRIGMQLTAWIVTSDEIEQGYDVPLSSVIWYGGQPWVYVRVADELYSRRPVSTYRETDYGWFIQDTFASDEQVVTRGGQLLLSEELRWQIPDEDDD